MLGLQAGLGRWPEGEELGEQQQGLATRGGSWGAGVRRRLRGHRKVASWSLGHSPPGEGQPRLVLLPWTLGPAILEPADPREAGRSVF